MLTFYDNPKLIDMINKIFLNLSIRYMPAYCLNSPQYIQIETSNRCNLSCIMCPIEELTRTRKAKMLSQSEFKEIIDQFPFLNSMTLHGIGEPLLNPELNDIIEISAARNISTDFFTNGMLLTENRAKELIKARLSGITISLDSINPDNYETIRRGAKFSKVVENISNFVNIRKSLKVLKPSIGIMTVAMNRNVQEWMEMIKFVYELGVDTLTIKGLNLSVDRSLKAEYKSKDIDRLLSFAKGLREKEDFNVILGFINNNKGKMLCRWPWQAAYITVEGEVTPCCNCPNPATLTFGNIFKQPFKKIWNNSALKEFRLALRNGKPDICRSCPDY